MPKIDLTIVEVKALAVACLLANGCNDENAEAVAEIVTAAERDDCTSHGLFRLPGYVAALRSGKVNGDASPSIECPAPGVLRIDGDGGKASAFRSSDQNSFVVAPPNTFLLWLKIEKCKWDR